VGVTTANRVFCWGSNRYGQVGDSSAGWKKFKPVQVAGNRQYKQVDAGLDYSCAVTTGNRAFCWGHGPFGVLGTGSGSSSRYPKPVSGGLGFERVSASNGFRTCAETTTNRAFCWGQTTGHSVMEQQPAPTASLR
jgi:alpha-tubulin suppressor-like RCC1 family protein